MLLFLLFCPFLEGPWVHSVSLGCKEGIWASAFTSCGLWSASLL